MEQQLPFQLPSEAENVCDDNSKGSPFDLSIGDLKEMKQIYQNVVSEYQSLLTLYAIEKERARKKGKLSMFPKAFSQWQPEGSKYSESQLNAIIGGPQSKATIFEQYSVETKQHSHSYHIYFKGAPQQDAKCSLLFFALFWGKSNMSGDGVWCN